MLIHEGGLPTGDYNECPGISGPIVDIVRKFDKAVDVVVTGHTHRAYVCEIDGRLVTSGDKYGTLVRRRIGASAVRETARPRARQSSAPRPTTTSSARRRWQRTRSKPRCFRPMTALPRRSPIARQAR